MRALFRFYKRYISPLYAPCCRFYPSCSEYAMLCFISQNPFRATKNTISRILRCNPLCPGGFDYPKAIIPERSLRKNLVSQKISIDIWLVPTGKNQFYIIKSLKDKN